MWGPFAVVSRRRILRRSCVVGLLCAAASIQLPGQTTSTQAPGETPKTAPQVARVLPTYEGQDVSTVELAGQPNLNENELLPLLSQRVGEPFAQKKIDESIAALKKTGKFHDVELEVRPEIEGVRVQFVLQPAYYFGIFDFPGGAFVGQLRDTLNAPLAINGLWGLSFATGGASGNKNHLLFTAGIGDEGHGLFGFIRPGGGEDGNN